MISCQRLLENDVKLILVKLIPVYLECSLSVECYKSSSWKLIGQFCRDVIGYKSRVAFVSCDWLISIRP